MGCQESKMSSSAVEKGKKPPVRRGIGHTERSFRTTPTAGGGGPSVMKPIDTGTNESATDEPQSLPELDDNGNLMPFEVSLRRSSSERSHKIVMGTAGNVNNTFISYAYATQRGYYPDDPHKNNQDEYSIIENFDGDSNSSFFAVYDGHGPYGDVCAKFAKAELPKLLKKCIRQKRVAKFKISQKERVEAGEKKLPFHPKHFPKLTPEELQEASTKAHLECNRLLLLDPKSSLSGTTAISVLFYNGQMMISNVGDSRAVLGFDSSSTTIDSLSSDEVKQEVHKEDDNGIVAIPLSIDQTPWRKVERERIIAAGGRVLTTDQVEGIEPIHQNFGDMVLGEKIDVEGDPPRVWLQNKSSPGTAFTRSIGDKTAETVGVNALPDITTKNVTETDKILVLASDGVFEFLSNQTVMDLCSKERKQPQSDPLDACDVVLQAAYQQWLIYERRTDDITLIVLFLENTTTPHNPNSEDFRNIMKLAARKSIKPMQIITENNDEDLQ